MLPTGDIEADMQEICSFYTGVPGKHPEKSCKAAIAPAQTDQVVYRKTP
jgi:hypothetical protein